MIRCNKPESGRETGSEESESEGEKRMRRKPVRFFFLFLSFFFYDCHFYFCVSSLFFRWLSLSSFSSSIHSMIPRLESFRIFLFSSAVITQSCDQHDERCILQRGYIRRKKKKEMNTKSSWSSSSRWSWWFPSYMRWADVPFCSSLHKNSFLIYFS